MLDPALRDVLADGAAPARAEAARELSHRAPAQTGQLRQRRRLADFVDALVDPPQLPRREAARHRSVAERVAVAAELDRQLERDELDEHLAREARMARLLGQAQQQAANVSVLDVEGRL